MSESQGSQGSKRKDLKASILATGIPLEMAVYGILASGLNADWIEPGYDFTTLDETASAIQRSVDFVASVPISRDPLEANSFHLYFLVECKYSAPEKWAWVFMPDAFPKPDPIFDSWRPSLWQDRAPREPVGTQAIQGTFSERAAGHHKDDRGLPRCVRGAVLGEEDGKRLPILSSGMYQLRDCLHHLAIERFRLFTKQWHRPAGLIFVPVVVTNASLQILKPDVYTDLLAAAADKPVELADVATTTERLLVRCPSAQEKVDWNWRRFHAAHSASDLTRIEKGLPHYKRERTIEAHFRNFFASTPAYIVIVRLELLSKLLTEVLTWAKGLDLR